MVTVPSRPYVVIPAALRRRCGLQAGDHLLLAASPGQDTLAAYSFAVWTRHCGRTPGPAAKGGGHDRREPGRLPAGGDGGSAGATGADGPDPGGPGRHPPGPLAGADLRRVHPGRIRGGPRRHPAGVRGSYWNRVLDQWGTRRLDEPTPSEIRQLMIYVKAHVVARRNARGGRSAEEHSRHW